MSEYFNGKYKRGDIIFYTHKDYDTNFFIIDDIVSDGFGYKGWTYRYLVFTSKGVYKYKIEMPVKSFEITQDDSMVLVNTELHRSFLRCPDIKSVT